MTLRRKLLWIAVVYLASGLGTGVARQVWPLYFRDRGLSLMEVGLASLLFLPWSLKMLWAPLLDRTGSRQGWAAGSLVTMAGATLGVLLLPVTAAGLSPLLWAMLFTFTLAAATVDLAVDAYAVDLATERHSGPINSTRVAAFRVGMVLFGGGLVLLADLESVGWEGAWLLLSAALTGLAMLVGRSPRVLLDAGERRRPLGALLVWALRPSMVPVLAFVFLFKLGDSALLVMAQTFWLDQGLRLAEVGLVSTTFGTLLSIVGAVAGGVLVARRGVFVALVVGGVAQALSNLGYLGVAVLALGRVGLYPAALLESFCQGLGTAAFLSFLMLLCRKEHAASQFALLTALYGLSRDLAAAVSGFGVEWLGYGGFFALSCLLSVPGLALLPALRRRINPQNQIPEHLILIVVEPIVAFRRSGGRFALAEAHDFGDFASDQAFQPVHGGGAALHFIEGDAQSPGDQFPRPLVRTVDFTPFNLAQLHGTYPGFPRQLLLGDAEFPPEVIEKYAERSSHHRWEEIYRTSVGAAMG